MTDTPDWSLVLHGGAGSIERHRLTPAQDSGVRAALRRDPREAGALVFPSIWYEGQPLTVLEAKALGTPVIVSDGCAGRDCVADGVDGLWFRRNDADNLAEALRRFGQADVDALSRAAYERYWAEPATLERHVAAILALYRGLLPAAAAFRLSA